MTTIEWLLIASIIVPLAYFTWSLLAIDRGSGHLVQQRLAALSKTKAANAEARPGLVTDLARKLTPGSYVVRLNTLLGNAGRPASMPLERLLTIKPLAALGGALFGLVMGGATSTKGMLLTLAAMAACYFIPDLLVYNNATKRRATMILDLPNVMDQLLISVEAGLGFESAMSRVGAGGKGPMAEELTRTMQDIQAGMTRREAYKALAARSSVPDLTSFVGAVVQADAQGLSISRVLRPQADQMRVKRRLRAEEKAMKLPVAVVFPLLLFIFPPLFIVILGPAVINTIDTFSRM